MQYLKSVFEYTFPVKGSMTDTFKKQWNLGMYAGDNKDRSNYRHHAVDALTIACIDRRKFNLLSEAIRNSSDGTHLKFAKPWDSFDKDVLAAVQYIVPKHFVDDNSLRQTKKVLRDPRTGKPKLDKNGNKIYIQGNTARGSLHKDTFYGCVMTPPEKDSDPQKIFVQRVSVDTLTKDSADKIVDKGICNTFISNLETGKQSLADIQKDGILLPYQINGKDVYVKRVRIKAKPTSPLVLKKHNNVIDHNPKDYKQSYYVVNDENYLIALYRGKDAKGKAQSDYIVLNLLDAVHKKQNGEQLYPPTKEKKDTNLKLYKVLKNGQIIILQNSVNENVFELSSKELFSRVYRISTLESDGRVNLSHVMIAEAKNKDNKSQCVYEGIDKYKRLSNSGLNCLVEGTDFTISPAGEIILKN